MVAAIAGVATVAGAAMSSSATKSAAKGQQAATDAANAESARQYDNNVALQAPTINTGNAARDRLSYLLGLSPTGFSGSTTVGGLGSSGGGSINPTEQTYDALRNQLLSQYTRTASNSPTPNGALAPGQQPTGLSIGGSGLQYGGNGDATGVPGWYDGRGQTSSTVDEAGLESAIQARLSEQQAARTAAEQAAQAAAAADPNYGKLGKDFEFQKFSYTGEDLFDDPSYQFRLDQGQKALDRQGAASGRFLSGAQLTAASNYNQGAASQEFQNAYSRALGTFGTNEGNRFNAYQANFNNSVNPLLSLAGAATLGSQNLGASGAATAAQIGANTTANANAQGAAGIANANNISGAMTGAVNNYQSNQLMNSVLNRNNSVNNNPYGASGLPNAAAYDFTRD